MHQFQVDDYVMWVDEDVTQGGRILAIRDDMCEVEDEYGLKSELPLSALTYLPPVLLSGEDYLAIVTPDPYQRFHARWQLEYDRLQPRIMDNRKVLDLCNLQQKDLMPLYDGLKYEIGRCPADLNMPSHKRMDEYLKQHKF